MRREIPLAITFMMGVFLIFQFFVPHENSQIVYTTLLDWVAIVAAFTLILGIGSLVLLHLNKIKRKKEGYNYSFVTISGLFFMLVFGLFYGHQEGSVFQKIFQYIQNPIEATMFSLLAFYIGSAAYRAFRARSTIATLLLIAAIIVMLGRVPIGQLIPGISDAADFIMNVPNMATKRAILIGVGFGIVATSLKIILGIERTYLGKE